MGWGWGHGAGYGMGVGMVLSGLLLVLVIAAVVFLVVRATSSDAGRAHGGGTPAAGQHGGVNPRELLALRYARGEISTAEYEERLSHLAP